MAGDRRANRQDAAEGGGGDRPAGRRLSSGDHNTKRAATVTTKRNAHATLHRELDRWCACRRFVHQFSLLAQPQPIAKKRNTGRGGRGAVHSRMWRPKLVKLGLVAVKHRQAMAERAAAIERHGKAFTALAHVVAAAVGKGSTSGTSAPQPQRPSIGDMNHGQQCGHCRNIFAFVAH